MPRITARWLNNENVVYGNIDDTKKDRIVVSVDLNQFFQYIVPGAIINVENSNKQYTVSNVMGANGQNQYVFTASLNNSNKGNKKDNFPVQKAIDED